MQPCSSIVKDSMLCSHVQSIVKDSMLCSHVQSIVKDSLSKKYHFTCMHIPYSKVCGTVIKNVVTVMDWVGTVMIRVGTVG